jgi:hypothetical protein
MRCSACGHESPVGAAFCLNCGNGLAAQTPAVGPGLPVICPTCRGENPIGMKFCRSCGSGLPVVGLPPVLITAPPIAGAQSSPRPVSAAVPVLPSPSQGPGLPQTMVPSNVMAKTIAPAGMGQLSPPLGGPATIPDVPPRMPGAMITCPRCATPTPLGFAYCQQCGLSLQPVIPTDPGLGRQRSPSNAPPIAAAAMPMPMPMPMPVGQPPIDPQAATLAHPNATHGVSPASSPLAVVRPPSAPMTAWGSAVLVNRDGTDGQRFALVSDDTVIGRAGADIAFEDDRFLARQHARITRTQDGSVSVRALDTINGVFKKCDAAVELADGAVLLLGREVLRFERVAVEERTAPPLVRHGIAVFGSPPRDPWGRLLQLVPSGGTRDVRYLWSDEIVLGRGRGSRLPRRCVHVAAARLAALGRCARDAHRPRQLQRHVRAYRCGGCDQARRSHPCRRSAVADRAVSAA